MKKVKNILMLLTASALFASCSVSRPYAVTNNPIGSKSGVSKTTCLFSPGAGGAISSSGICFNGKYGIYEAAKNGKIDKVATVDIKESNFLLFRTFEMVVTGE